jgi:nucleoside-diphosphate-sugar epimerase
MIDPGPRGVQSLMNAASEYGGATLKRVILTGSVVSCVDPFLGPANGRDKPWDEEDWNPITYDAAIASNHAGLAYFATKTLAEQAAWAFMATHKPRFDLTVLLPSITLGPVLTPVIAANQIEQGADKHVYAFFNGVHKDADCPFIFYSHVDVRDVARAHILSMTLPAAGGQRIALTTSELLSPQRVVNIINGRFPQLRDRVARGDLYQLYPSGSKPTLANGTKAERIFGDGWRYRTVEETVTDVVTQILEQEKSWGPCVQ